MGAAFMTPAGWAHYQELSDQAGAIPAAATTSEPVRDPGGLAGFRFAVRRSLLWFLSSTSAGVILLWLYRLALERAERAVYMPGHARPPCRWADCDTMGYQSGFVE